MIQLYVMVGMYYVYELFLHLDMCLSFSVNLFCLFTTYVDVLLFLHQSTKCFVPILNSPESQFRR
jgi:hypothetical protein